jgi:hypothetical protein
VLAALAEHDQSVAAVLQVLLQSRALYDKGIGATFLRKHAPGVAQHEQIGRLEFLECDLLLIQTALNIFENEYLIHSFVLLDYFLVVLARVAGLVLGHVEDNLLGRVM